MKLKLWHIIWGRVNPKDHVNKPLKFSVNHQEAYKN